MGNGGGRRAPRPRLGLPGRVAWNLWSSSPQRGAAAALRLGEDRERLAGAVLLGKCLADLLATALAAALLAGLLGAWGALAAALLMTALVVVFAELLPRSWTVGRAEALAVRAAPVLVPLVAVLAPPAGMLGGVARGVLSAVGVVVDPKAAVLSAQPEIAGAIALHHPEGMVESDRNLLLGALDLGDRQVEEVMMHRRDIEMIDADAAPAEILEQAINSPHTRLPIFRGEPENIVGVIHAKDLSRAVHRFVREQRAGEGALEGFDIMDVAMPPYFVPESTPLDEQMREFLRRRTHFALVVDEYGALQGLVTLEDILEEIVGDITDEHDLEAPAGIEPQPDGSVEVDGAVSIRDLNRACDWNLPDEEANTIAGLVIHEAQAIPSEGQVFGFHGFRFEVLKRDGNRLARLRMRRLE
nr:CNNM domain-containing protein [uncultured Amaricoccus sp.]